MAKLPSLRRPAPDPRVAVGLSWVLALALPAISSVIWRVWLNGSISSQACFTGTPGLGVGSVAIFIVLVAATPLAIWQYARRTGTQHSPYVVAAFALGTFVAFAALYLVAADWWSGHGCAT